MRAKISLFRVGHFVANSWDILYQGNRTLWCEVAKRHATKTLGHSAANRWDIMVRGDQTLRCEVTRHYGARFTHTH